MLEVDGELMVELDGELLLEFDGRLRLENFRLGGGNGRSLDWSMSALDRRLDMDN